MYVVGIECLLFCAAYDRFLFFEINNTRPNNGSRYRVTTGCSNVSLKCYYDHYALPGPFTLVEILSSGSTRDVKVTNGIDNSYGIIQYQVPSSTSGGHKYRCYSDNTYFVEVTLNCKLMFSVQTVQIQFSIGHWHCT